MTGKSKLVFFKGWFESVEKLSAKDNTEDFDGQKELGSAGNPSSLIWGEPATWDYAMQVGVMEKSLAPSMENRQKPDLSAKVLGIGGDLN